jgi:hypothetical protein
MSRALAALTREAGHPELADKIETAAELTERLAPAAGGHRPLTPDELAAQRAAALTLGEQMLAQKIEYGTYRATAPITVGGVLAYLPGYPVPVGNVEAHGYALAGLVERVPWPPDVQAATSGRPAASSGGVEQA